MGHFRTVVIMFLSALALAIAISSGPQAQQSVKHYAAPRECAFTFDYPNDWVVSPTDEKCTVRLQPSDFAAKMKEYDVDVYSLEVGRRAGDFLAVASANFFDFVRGEWVLLGGHGMAAADVVRTEQWSGLRGTAAARCYHEGGGYAGACDELVVVLRDDDDNVWSMRGGPQSEEAFDTILASFKFVEL